MHIQKVEPSKKHQVSVLIDGEKYLFDIDVWLLSGYRENVEITETQLETLTYKSEFTRAKNKAVWLLSNKDYTRKQLFDKLKPDFDEGAIEEALTWLVDNGLQNDLVYARAFSSFCMTQKKLAPPAIRMELRAKGIERDDIDCVMMEIEETFDAQNQISELINQKYPNALKDESEKRRAVAALQRKGYSYGDIKTALNLLIEEE